MPRNFVISLVSQFDAYVGELIRTIYIKKPELLNFSEKTLTLAELLQFDSIDTAKEYVLEKEIESVLRKSHSDQFDWMEKKFNLPLRKGLQVWPVFIELTERRNLFVHTDGVVSSQYINVCCNHGSDVNGISGGDELDASIEYFKESYEVVYEVGFKLGHVLWRKMFPDERKDADDNYNSLCYELIHEEKYELAKNLLDFIVDEIKIHSDDYTKKVFVINRAQVYKWLGHEGKCQEILKSVDWSACSLEFQLCQSVLLNDYEKALEIVRQSGKSGKMNAFAYRDWPVLKEFRKNEDFIKLFEETFGEPLGLIDMKQQAVDKKKK